MKIRHIALVVSFVSALGFGLTGCSTQTAKADAAPKAAVAAKPVVKAPAKKVVVAKKVTVTKKAAVVALPATATSPAKKVVVETNKIKVKEVVKKVKK